MVTSTSGTLESAIAVPRPPGPPPTMATLSGLDLMLTAIWNSTLWNSYGGLIGHIYGCDSTVICCWWNAVSSDGAQMMCELVGRETDLAWRSMVQFDGIRYIRIHIFN